jgi:hypothetical protein
MPQNTRCSALKRIYNGFLKDFGAIFFLYACMGCILWRNNYVRVSFSFSVVYAMSGDAYHTEVTYGTWTLRGVSNDSLQISNYDYFSCLMPEAVARLSLYLVKLQSMKAYQRL